jgi:hypothetical protein
MGKVCKMAENAKRRGCDGGFGKKPVGTVSNDKF